MGQCFDSLECARRVLLIAADWEGETLRLAERAAGLWQWDAVLALQGPTALSIGPQVTRLSDAISPEEHFSQRRDVTDVLYLAGHPGGSGMQLAASVGRFQRILAAANAAGCRLSSARFLSASEHLDADVDHMQARQQIKAHRSSHGDAFRLAPDASHPPSVSKQHQHRPLPEYGLPEALAEAWTRGRWLLGLLVLQSASSAVLDAYQGLLKNHMVVTFFLTMLVGAGGNAGNQSAIKVIRSLAMGKHRADSSSMRRALLNQALVALLLGGVLSEGAWALVCISHHSLQDATATAAALLHGNLILGPSIASTMNTLFLGTTPITTPSDHNSIWSIGAVGGLPRVNISHRSLQDRPAIAASLFLIVMASVVGDATSIVGGLARVYISHHSLRDAAAIAASLFLIVMASVVLGTLLPFGLARCGHDPAHAGSSIQVLMDVLGGSALNISDVCTTEALKA